MPVNQYYAGQPSAYSPEYTAYLNRVVAAGGSIYSQPATQAALNVLAAQSLASSAVQWLDVRFGKKLLADSITALYNLPGAAQDATGAVAYGVDAALGPVAGPVVNSGLSAGSVAALAVADSYTWGMRYQFAATGDGIMFGNRYGGYAGSQWQRAQRANQSLYDQAGGGNNQAYLYTLTLPAGVWGWLWVVKNGGTYTTYTETGAAIGSRYIGWPIGGLPFGLGAGPDNNEPFAGLRFQSMVRFTGALTAAQRAAIQGI